MRSLPSTRNVIDVQTFAHALAHGSGQWVGQFVANSKDVSGLDAGGLVNA